MVIIYKIDKARRRLKFDKSNARTTDDGMAWRVRIVDRNEFGKPTDTFTEHVIPLKDIIDIRNDLEDKEKHKIDNNVINSITNY